MHREPQTPALVVRMQCNAILWYDIDLAQPWNGLDLDEDQLVGPTFHAAAIGNCQLRRDKRLRSGCMGRMSLRLGRKMHASRGGIKGKEHAM